MAQPVGASGPGVRTAVEGLMSTRPLWMRYNMFSLLLSLMQYMYLFTVGCSAGYYGDACSVRCGEGCVDAVCNATDGSCVCLSGWQPPFCADIQHINTSGRRNLNYSNILA
jgi:hypothetical protein